MIIFDLICEYEHRFEGWFKNSDEFNRQQNSGMLTCPICDSENIVKVPSVSHLNLGKQKKIVEQQIAAQNQQMALAEQVSRYIENNFEDVGVNFAETAKKIHYGEEAQRNIRGMATQKETRELLDEGINVIPLSPNQKKNQPN